MDIYPPPHRHRLGCCCSYLITWRRRGRKGRRRMFSSAHQHRNENPTPFVFYVGSGYFHPWLSSALLLLMGEYDIWRRSGWRNSQKIVCCLLYMYNLQRFCVAVPFCLPSLQKTTSCYYSVGKCNWQMRLMSNHEIEKIYPMRGAVVFLGRRKQKIVVWYAFTYIYCIIYIYIYRYLYIYFEKKN